MLVKTWRRWSSVQTRVTALMLAMASLAVFGLVMSGSSETRRNDAQLAADAKEHGELLDRTLELEGGSLKVLASDYSYWDEMVGFVETRDMTWASVNLDEALNTYRADAEWVFDAGESLLYTVRDSTLETFLEPVPPGLSVKDALGDSHLCHYFIAGPGGPVEIRGATIHPSDDPERKTPVRGYFLVARSWNRQYLAELSRLTGKTMRIEPSRAETKSSAAIARQFGEITFMRPLPGPRGKPELMLTASLRPGWIVAARRSGRGLFAQQLALSLLGVLSLTLVLWLWVTRPLGRIRHSLESGSTEALKPLERNRTEFGQLAQLVGQFFGQNVALVKEVNERKQAEAALRESELTYRRAFESSNDAMMLLDSDRFLDCNEATLRVFGYSARDEFLGKHPGEISPPLQAGGRESRIAADENIATAFRDGRNFFEWLHQRADGTVFPADVLLTPLDYHGRKVLQATVRDITPRKIAEAEIAQKNVQLVQLNDLKNQFLGMAAHDLRNPLAVVSAASSFLLDDAGKTLPETKKTDFLRRIKNNGEFMLKLIDNLLDVAKIESGQLDLELADGDLCGLIEENLTMNRMLAEKKGIRLDFMPGCGLPLFRFDRGKVEQVLNNLISNALKFSKPGTAVAVQASRVNGSVVVSVSDQGQGIPAEELDKLFKPFGRTTVRSTAGEKGTGLGLAICRKIVEGHHGRIWAESEPGKGSTFSFALPVRSDDKL